MAKKAVVMSPAEITEKFIRRSKQATPDIIAGINRVTENPAAKAAGKSKKWLNNVSQSEAKYKAGLAKVTLEGWKKNAAEKTQTRHAAGVDACEEKHRQFTEYLVPAINAGLNKISGMNDMTLDDNINRAVTFMRHMADNKYKK